ncbi:molybdopterin-dependent oxidoreductase [Sulfitobacter sp. SK012]|uniref:molybdopterin-dependent oxidoreductase n=1 Tax=Sulfitobacter sp. SK012 TaxID=1389005 RepID=UPI0013B40A4F
MSWSNAYRLFVQELQRVIREHGNEAIYAGSYGWASAGRFHHAQSQLKRFLNCIGGFTNSVGGYSFGDAQTIVPHVLGTFHGHLDTMTGWETIATDCELFVAFGGFPLKNGQISPGGTGRHVHRDGLHAAGQAGVQFVNISPLRSDLMEEVDAQWLAPRSSTDAALLLALAYEI